MVPCLHAPRKSREVVSNSRIAHPGISYFSMDFLGVPVLPGMFSRNPDFPISGFRISGCLDFWISGFSDLRISGLSGFRNYNFAYYILNEIYYDKYYFRAIHYNALSYISLLKL